MRQPDRENNGADVVVFYEVRAVFGVFKLRTVVVDVTHLSIIHRYVIELMTHYE